MRLALANLFKFTRLIVYSMGGKGQYGRGYEPKGKTSYRVCLMFDQVVFFTGPQVQTWARIGGQVAEKILQGEKENQEDVIDIIDG